MPACFLAPQGHVDTDPGSEALEMACDPEHLLLWMSHHSWLLLPLTPFPSVDSDTNPSSSACPLHP